VRGLGGYRGDEKEAAVMEERPARRTLDAECAWCAERFPNIVDLLEHIEELHLPPRFDLAA
jgi:hypothetical protein